MRRAQQARVTQKFFTSVLALESVTGCAFADRKSLPYSTLHFLPIVLGPPLR